MPTFFLPSNFRGDFRGEIDEAENEKKA